MMAESDELVSFRNSDDKTLAKMFKVESRIKENLPKYIMYIIKIVQIIATNVKKIVVTQLILPQSF